MCVCLNCHYVIDNILYIVHVIFFLHVNELMKINVQQSTLGFS